MLTRSHQEQHRPVHAEDNPKAFSVTPSSSQVDLPCLIRPDSPCSEPAASATVSPSRTPSIVPPSSHSVSSRKTKKRGRDPTMMTMMASHNTRTTTLSRFNKGRWTADEHAAFLEAVRHHGHQWTIVAKYVGRRTPAQVRSHAQKHWLKLRHEQEQQQQQHRAAAVSLCVVSSSRVGGCVTTTTSSSLHAVTPQSLSVQRILQDPASVHDEVVTTLQQLRQRHTELRKRFEQVQRRQQQEREDHDQCRRDSSLSASTVPPTVVPSMAQSQKPQSHTPNELIALTVLRECLPRARTATTIVAATP